MDLQQTFGQRLLQLLEEKEISQGVFADKMGCSRQSINFYILGKRSPDIVLAAQMAQYLGVSCDYLVGLSDFRADCDANLSVNQAGLTEDTAKFFAGLKILSTGLSHTDEEAFANLGFDYHEDILPGQMLDAQRTLSLLNRLISHDQFGVLLQYIKKYRDICHGEDTLANFNELMLKMVSPLTGIQYGTQKEQTECMQEFCLYVTCKYFDEIVKEITK